MFEAIILAAGKGKRLGDLGQEKQKVTLDVGKPLLEHNIKLLEEYCDKIVIIVGHRKEDVINCANGFHKKVKIVFVEQKIAQGTAQAIGLAKKHIEKDFFVIYGDTLLKKEHLDKLAKAGANTLALYKVDDPWNYGVVKLNGIYMTDIIEKPAKGTESGNMVHAGLNLFNKKIFQAIEKTKINPIRNEYEITDSYRILLSEGEKIKTVQIEKPLHISTEEDYKKANGFI